MKVKEFKVRVYCSSFYDSKIEVPADMDLDKAFDYAKEHLDEIKLTQMQYLPDSDEIEIDNCQLDERCYCSVCQNSEIGKEDRYCMICGTLL